VDIDEIETPDLKDRLQALMLDVIILFALMFGLYKVFDALGDVSDLVRMWSFIFLWYIYDPLLTSLFGGTLGHLSMGLRVRRMSDPSRRINILAAYVRFTVKALLGFISVIVVAASSRGQGIHDLVSSSIVIRKRDENKQVSQEELLDVVSSDDDKDVDEHLVG